MVRKRYDLIGGHSHGQKAERADTETSFEAPVPTNEEDPDSGKQTESYTKRRFTGEEFGDGYECFAVETDDETETKELARMELKNREPDDDDQPTE